MSEVLERSLRDHIAISDEEVKVVKRKLVTKTVRKRQFLMNPGDVCEHMIFVKRGLLRLFFVDKSKSEHIIQFATERW